MENFLHIKELKERVELSAQLKKVGAIDEVEERALWIFEVISKGLGFSKNIFKIGDMTVYKEIRIGGEEIVKEAEPALAVARGSEIYIDRGCLKKALVASNSKIFLIVIGHSATNMEVIAHELAIMYNTDKQRMFRHSGDLNNITRTVLRAVLKKKRYG